mgnify:CR=1 FL=1
MNLITKISTYFIISSILLFILISIGLSFFINEVFRDEIDEQLVSISYKAELQIKKGKDVNFYPIVQAKKINYKSEKEKFSDVVLNIGDETELFREYKTIKRINNNYYEICARNSIVDSKDFLFSILFITLFAFLVFLIILYFINKYLSKTILSDFYTSLSTLENFSLQDNSELKLSKSNILEFRQLNSSLLYLAEKAKKEYRLLKEFSEETNHEFQTPIAVIKSKLELLLQSNNLNSEELNNLGVSINNLSKLEKLNKAILLLNKLNHRELFVSETINIVDELKKIIDEFSELISLRAIELTVLLPENFYIKANHSLINILLSNLLSNSLKHNVKNGIINIKLDENKLIITNTAEQPKIDPELFFTRFYKDYSDSESLGLGLTIAQKICELYKFLIINSFENNTYTIIIEFTINKIE